MSYVIGEKCVRCGTCERYCPVEAISDLGGSFVIDAGRCIECGTCDELCPSGAISLGISNGSGRAEAHDVA